MNKTNIQYRLLGYELDFSSDLGDSRWLVVERRHKARRFLGGRGARRELNSPPSLFLEFLESFCEAKERARGG